MILCHNRKFAVLHNPKTGSVTVSHVFRNQTLDENKHDHVVYSNPDYRLFSFFRDPVERYISAFNYIKRLHYSAIELLHYFYGEKISCAKVMPYDEFTEDQKNKIDNVSPIQYFDHFVAKKCGGIPFAFQTYWLDRPNMTLLDYRNFDMELTRLCKEFDFEPDLIPRMNESRSRHKVSDLIEDEYNKIANFYQQDYDFLRKSKIDI